MNGRPIRDDFVPCQIIPAPCERGLNIIVFQEEKIIGWKCLENEGKTEETHGLVSPRR